MRASVVAVAVAASLALPAGARAKPAGVTTLLVIAHKPGGVVEYGNAFVVRRPGDPERRLLVTALHVVFGSRRVQTFVVNCTPDEHEDARVPAWTAVEGTPIWIWPQYDLAAIPLDAPAIEAIWAAVAKLGSATPTMDGVLAFQPPARDLEEGTELALDATSSVNPCQAGDARVLYTPNVRGYESSGVATVGMGSMEDAAPLVVYDSAIAAGGASGAAIVEPGAPPRVLGVHLAGFGKSQPACALWTEKLGESLWTTPEAIVALGLSRWPGGYEPPGTRQSAEQIPAAVRTSTVRYVPGDRFVAASTTVEFGWGTHAYEGPITGVRATFTGAPDELRGGAWLASAGVRRSRYRESFVAPDGVALGARDPAEWGGTLAAGAEYRFTPLHRLRFAAGASLRLWTFSLDPIGWVPSLPVHGRATWTLVDRISVALEAFVAPEYGHEPKRVYTGIGAEARDRPRAWGATFGGALGLEY